VRRPLHARVGRRSVAPVARLARGLRPVAGPRDGPRRVRRGLDLRRHDVVHLLPDGQRLERVLFYLLRGSTPASDVREMYREEHVGRGKTGPATSIGGHTDAPRR
jgi:hypothetical protein